MAKGGMKDPCGVSTKSQKTMKTRLSTKTKYEVASAAAAAKHPKQKPLTEDKAKASATQVARL